MTDKQQLYRCREIPLTACGGGALKDIREIATATEQPVLQKSADFLEKMGNPYLFRVADTVVKIDYVGTRSFGEAMAALLSNG